MKFLNKNNCELSTIAIMGTGYVGLPLINLLSQKIDFCQDIVTKNCKVK